MKKMFIMGLALVLCCGFFETAFVFPLTINELIPRIRSEFNIPQDNVPDELLVRFLEDKTNKIMMEALILQIDDGNSIQDAGIYEGEYAVLFFSAVLKKAWANTISLLVDKVFYPKLIWTVYGLYDILYSGGKTYLKLADALCAKEITFLSIEYVDARESGKSPQSTWEELNKTFGDTIIALINELKSWEPIDLQNYCEMYYHAWALAHNKSGQKDLIRKYIYEWLDIIIPKVNVTPRFDVPGSTFHFAWTGFKPNSIFIAYLLGPNRIIIREMTIRADRQGQATYDFQSGSSPIGTYETWAIERKSGLSTDRISFEIRENRAPAIPGTPSGPYQGYANNIYSFATSTSDPEGHPIQYQYDWGDGNVSNWGESTQSHAWNTAGVYAVKARAKDAYDACSEWSASSQLSIFLLGNSHILNISSGLGGNTDPGPGQYIYTTNASVQVSAVPASGYVFNRWVGSLPAELLHTNPVPLTMDQDVTIQAEFSATSEVVAWPMNLHDVRNSGQSECSGPQSNNLSWTYTLSSGPFEGYVGTPVVAGDGTVYIGSGTMYQGYLNAIDRDGNLKWRSMNLGACPNAPAIGEDGTIYVALYDSGGYFYALNPQDGSVKWNYWVGDRTSDPIIGSDGTIYFTSENRYLYALKPDGNLKWQYYTGQFVGSPIISNSGSIYIFSWIYGGLSMSEISLDGIFISGRALYMGMYSSGASISVNGTMYISSGTNVFAFSSEGDPIWGYYPGVDCETNYSSPIQISNELVVAASKGKVYFIDASTGVQQSSYVDPDSASLAPLQCVVDKDGVVYTGFRDNSSVSGPSKLVAVNPDGTLKWSYTLHWLDTRPAISDGVLYIAGIGTDYTLRLYAFRL